MLFCSLAFHINHTKLPRPHSWARELETQAGFGRPFQAIVWYAAHTSTIMLSELWHSSLPLSLVLFIWNPYLCLFWLNSSLDLFRSLNINGQSILLFIMTYSFTQIRILSP